MRELRIGYEFVAGLTMLWDALDAWDAVGRAGAAGWANISRQGFVGPTIASLRTRGYISGGEDLQGEYLLGLGCDEQDARSTGSGQDARAPVETCDPVPWYHLRLVSR